MQSSRASDHTAGPQGEQQAPQPGEPETQQPGQPETQQPEAGQPAAGDQPRPARGDGGGAEQDLRAELDRMEDRYKRALAELDNYRKRAARELERMIAERREGLLRDWLDVVDGLDRALRHQPDGPVTEGLRALLSQMEAILTRQGVQRIGQPGEQFDPERHEAVDVRTTDEHPDRAIIDVVRSGYALDGRVIRPAQVIVARAPQAGADAQQPEG
jgi:molecular chaperone GrpE